MGKHKLTIFVFANFSRPQIDHALKNIIFMNIIEEVKFPNSQLESYINRL